MLASFSVMSQEIELKKELVDDILKRYPKSEIKETTIRTGAYRTKFSPQGGVDGTISYRLDNDSFQQCQLTYSELPAQLSELVLDRIKESDIIHIKLIMQGSKPSYYTIRGKSGGLIFDENYEFLANGILLNGLEVVPPLILSHLKENYDYLTIKEVGYNNDKYFAKIEFNSSDTFGQPAIVKYSSEFEWTSTSRYYFDLSSLPIEIFLALDNYGGIEAVKQARQFFLPKGKFYFQVELKGQKVIYYDHEYQEMEAPTK